ncbi:MAG: ATP synthase subunit I [Gallionella sp.]
MSRAFKSAAHWQIISTLILAFAALILVGVHAAASAFMGGAVALIGCYAGVVTTRSRATSPGAILIALLRAEAIKVAMIALLLLLVFKLYKGLVPLALISGLAVAVLISGAGLRTLENENK